MIPTKEELKKLNQLELLRLIQLINIVLKEKEQDLNKKMKKI